MGVAVPGELAVNIGFYALAKNPAGATGHRVGGIRRTSAIVESEKPFATPPGSIGCRDSTDLPIYRSTKR